MISPKVYRNARMRVQKVTELLLGVNQLLNKCLIGGGDIIHSLYSVTVLRMFVQCFYSPKLR